MNDKNRLGGRALILIFGEYPPQLLDEERYVLKSLIKHFGKVQDRSELVGE